MNQAVELQALALRVNGKVVAFAGPPAKRLSDVLRDDFGLTGTKVGCHAGDCGACTVLLDGKQVCSCITAAAQCAGKSITTVEGLAENGDLNALQKAFLAHGAAQCGICTPGMLMAATDVLRRHPHPTEQQVQDGLAGVLCRCTGYRKIVAAVLEVGANDALGALRADAPSELGAGRAVGARMTRLDGPAKLVGAEIFGADKYPADSLWMRTVRSPHARARFTIGDLDRFQREYPQVEAILTARDVPENSFCVFPVPKDQPVLADGHVRMRGEAVMLLLGEMDAILSIPEAAIPIAWRPEPALDSPEKALVETGALIHDFAPENVLCRGRVAKGNAEQVLREAAFVAEGEFRTAYVEHAYIEPEAGYAEIFEEKGEQRIRIFASTQTPVMDRDEVARVLKLPHSAVHIVPSAVGGGFGGKLDVAIQPLLAVAAWKLKRSVRAVYTRAESMLSTTKRHPSRIRARFGCDEEGNLLALDFHADFNTGAYASWGSTVANRVPVHATGPYYVPHLRALTRAVYTNNAIGGAFRGFGVPQAHVATEALIDELALKVGMDPLAFRLKNAIRAGQPTATGQVLTASVGMRQCLEALQPAWNAGLTAVRDFNSAAGRDGLRQRRGIGVASMWYGIGNTVIANPSTMTAALRSNGRLFLYNGAQEIGQGSGTVIPQVFADAVGLPIALVDQVIGDTDLTEDAGKSSASRQTFVSGNAARFAGEDLRRQLLELLGLESDALLRLEGSMLHGSADGIEKSLDLRTLAANKRGDVATGRGYFNPPTIPLDADGQGSPYATYAFAAQMAQVEVDLDLGTVKVLHVHAAHDVGRAVNPTQVEGQIEGGVAQGLGMALMEEYISGRTDNLHDYLIPTVGDMPPVTSTIIEDPEPLGPFGAKGVGEPALIATPPAILNAIYNATGARVRHLPATPDRVRQAILALIDSPHGVDNATPAVAVADDKS
ncbi:MAG: molybdopterin-dependent oxidoreductase [Herminiimonas sp.]|nr:molybdopterin-dependent oxidoreductase [Herminiimonas sp.]